MSDQSLDELLSGDLPTHLVAPSSSAARWSLADAEDRLFELESDARAVARELPHALREGVNTVFCTDSDVLRSAVGVSDRLASDDQSVSLWSSAFLEINAAPTVLLPGTLHELIEYSSNRSRASSRLVSTDMTDALARSIVNLDLDEIGLPMGYQDALGALKSARLSKGDYFLFFVLKHKAGVAPKLNSDINRQVFLEGLQFLARRDRAKFTRNNRIDVYNYCYASTLNKQREGTRHVIVSNSKHMLEMDNYLSGFSQGTQRNAVAGRNSPVFFSRPFETAGVWRPERAVIYNLILASTNDNDLAVKKAWALVSNLSRFRSELAHDLASGAARGGIADIVARYDDALLAITAKFMNVQSLLDQLRFESDAQVQLLQNTLSIKSAGQFYDSLRKSINKVFSASGLVPRFRQEVPSLQRDLQPVDVYKNKAGFTYTRQVDIIEQGDTSTVVASVFEYDDRVVIKMTSSAPVEQFMSVVNALRSNSLFKLSGQPGRSPRVVVRTSGRELKVLPLEQAAEIKPADRLFAELGLAADEVNAVRVYAEDFIASLDGRTAKLHVNSTMLAEAEFFTRELAMARYKTSDFTPSLKVLFSSKPN